MVCVCLCVRADSDTNTFYFANGDTTKPIIRNEWAFGYVQPALDPVQVRRRRPSTAARRCITGVFARACVCWQSLINASLTSAGGVLTASA